MGIEVNLTAQEMTILTQQVEAFNKALGVGKAQQPGGELGKDDFLKILVTQLSHQDPTQPMEDREFIAQMAQFSSLEQMTNMSEGLAKVATLLARAQAVALLGQVVDIAAGDGIVSGLVDEVSGGDYPQILVNGAFYDASQVLRVRKQAEE